MEENMNLNLGLQYDFMDFMDFMGVGAQHDDDEISPAEHELDPEQGNMNLDYGSPHSFIDFLGLGTQHDDGIDDPQERDPAIENMNLDRGSPYRFIDFLGLGAQHGDDIDDPQELDPATENMNLDRGSPYRFIDFLGLGAQHGDDIDIDVDDLIPQEPDPVHVHHQQRDSTVSRCSDVDDARLVDRVYNPMELLPTGEVERDRLDDRNVRLDLESSMRLLRQEESQFLSLQLGPASEATSEPALGLSLDPVTLDPVTAEDWAAWGDIVHHVLSFILLRILMSTVY